MEKSMQKQLTVHNATVTTASVEVKTLTISGKQVTLAVFRQLREEQLVAEDGSLNGAAWGYVNYHPDKCDGDGHWHVVWQRGDELLRSKVDKKPLFDYPTAQQHQFTPAEGILYVRALVCEWLNDRLSDSPIATDPSGRSSVHPWVAVHELTYGFGFPVTIPISKRTAAALDAKHNAEAGQANLARALNDANQAKSNVEWWQKRADDSMQNFLEARAAFEAATADAQGRTCSQLAEATNAAVHAEARRRQRHRDTLKVLAELPQLFIAV